VINGQTCIMSALRASRMQGAGYTWDIQWHGPEADCTGCTIWLKHHGKPMLEAVRDKDGIPARSADGKPEMRQVRVSFLKRDAEQMLTTIWENNSKKRVSILEKDNWKMSKRNMYFARAITNAQRW